MRSREALTCSVTTRACYKDVSKNRSQHPSTVLEKSLFIHTSSDAGIVHFIHLLVTDRSNLSDV